MIIEWLLKHRWINELLKTMVAGAFAWLGYMGWQGGKIASAEMSDVVAASVPLMTFGVFVGIMGMLALIILTDVVYRIIEIVIKGQ